MYPTSGATLRADLNIKVEEAAAADDFFIGHLAMPEMGVDAKSGTYPKLKLAEAELLTPGSTVRERGGSYGEASRSWGNDTYDCVDRGLEEPVDDTDAKDVGRFFNVEASHKTTFSEVPVAMTFPSALQSALVTQSENPSSGPLAAASATAASLGSSASTAPLEPNSSSKRPDHKLIRLR